MGRRSLHTPEELRALILNAAETLVENGGLEKLSARSIAKEIGYAPGTLYNVYDNIDDIILRIEGRLLDELDTYVSDAIQGQTGRQAMHAFASAYIQFAHQKRSLWHLLQEHSIPSELKVPDWYSDKIQAPVKRLRKLLAQEFPHLESDRQERGAIALWGSIHGQATLATSRKLGVQEHMTPQLLSETIDSFLNGLPATEPETLTKPQLVKASEGQRH